jgi:hypothetical protein
MQKPSVPIFLPIFLMAIAGAIGATWPSRAQVNMQYSGLSNGQYSGQANGQVDLRVDGRPNRNEGLPPSVADKANYKFQNPIHPNDCNEVEAINPDARPYWQARVRSACQN